MNHEPHAITSQLDDVHAVDRRVFCVAMEYDDPIELAASLSFSDL